MLYDIDMLKFIVDFEKDIWNWKRIFGSERVLYPIERLPQGDHEFIMSIKEVHDDADINRVWIDFIEKKYGSGMRVDLFAIAAKKEWDIVEEKIFALFEQITKKPFVFRDVPITAVITTAKLAPYNVHERWLMLFPSATIEYARTLIAHELLHFHFHEQYEQALIKNGVSKDDFHTIKEAMTVLLNAEEFKDVITVPDKGYEVHNELRNKLHEEWEKTKNFDHLIDVAVDFVKK